jgi:hypothetical protein
LHWCASSPVPIELPADSNDRPFKGAQCIGIHAATPSSFNWCSLMVLGQSNASSTEHTYTHNSRKIFFFQQRHMSLSNSCLRFLRTGTLSTLYLLSGLLLPITPCGSRSHRHPSSSALQPSPHHGCVPNGSSVYLCESRSCSVLTVCGAPVGREKVSTQVMLLRVGLATLGLVCLCLNSLWAGAHSAS